MSSPGRLDFLVDDAGITGDRTAVDMNEGAWNTGLAVDLSGAAICPSTLTLSLIAGYFPTTRAHATGVVAPRDASWHRAHQSIHTY
ncbi:hypothetical protein OHA40_24500 [Nocardia sp. NBC_00508]|uniref:hypothetical protein n=1 Tax=Nocardia sp. NBC_00508 TaxID=2975992 RepID=UPI002E807F93|nr:hypothetical protein [Nocardia sp. NBC_00508]WUD64820.1 hypothetical protein OHA40_24500 [Nocardia sp. NBC_00508]